MNDRQRFNAIMGYQPADRLPVYYFSVWNETLERWLSEGLSSLAAIPAVTGLDPDWEVGMWHCHGMVNTYPISDDPTEVLEETDDWRIERTALGAIIKVGKHGSSIPQHVQPALLPTRESWENFKKYLKTDDPRRYKPGWESIAEGLRNRTGVATFLGGSLYGWPREWMDTEGISYLPYDDPELFEEIISYLADHFMTLNRPILERVQFDFAYIFEDCCFNNGPLFSPDIYKQFYDHHYRRMIDFYHQHGVKYVLIDSDGKIDDLLPCWLDSGFDIIFPIEVGTWQANPVELRKRYGKRLRMMGGVDKLLIPLGEAAIRAHLEPMRELAAEGGFIPIPDHRIPPDCSLEQFKTYVRVFKEVFA